MEIREGESVLKECVGRRLHKIDVKGQAWCLLCECTVSYASRGLRNLTDHFQTKKHVKRVRGVLNNQRLTGKAIYFIHNYVLSGLKLPNYFTVFFDEPTCHKLKSTSLISSRSSCNDFRFRLKIFLHSLLLLFVLHSLLLLFVLHRFQTNFVTKETELFM